MKLRVTPSCFGGLQAADAPALALSDAPADSLAAGELAAGASELGAAEPPPPPPELHPTTIALVARNAKTVRERRMLVPSSWESAGALASSSTRDRCIVDPQRNGEPEVGRVSRMR